MAAIIFVVNDHDGVRTALRLWLEEEFPPISVIGLCGIEEVLARICSMMPDLILMDIGFSQRQGIAALHNLKTILPGVPIVILTIFDDLGHRAQALQAGADVFISVRKMHEELIPQLEALLSRVPT